MRNGTPSVSIILPTYNRPLQLMSSVYTVLSQTYGDFELIIIDDSSSDESVNLTREITDDRLTHIHTGDRRGVAEARNDGIQRANGKYIAFIDDDDIWLPWKLDIQVNLIESRSSSASLVLSSFFIVDEVTGDLSLHIDDRNTRFHGIPSRWLLKKKAIEEIDMFDPAMESMEDLDLTARLSSKYDIIFDDTPSMIYFDRPDSISKLNKYAMPGRERLLSKHGKIMSKEMRIRNRFHLAVSYMEEEKFDHASRMLIDAISEDMSNVKLYIALLVSLTRSKLVFYGLKRVWKRMN